MESSTEIQRLLHPIAPRTFLEEHWERAPLHVPGDRGKLAGLFDRAAFEAALSRAPDGSSLIKAANRTPDGTHRELTIAPRQAKDLLALGFTICLARVDTLDERVGGLVRSLKRELLASGFISANCYVSPDAHGFGTHFDNHSVLILQLEGAKRWGFSRRPAVEAPTENFFPGTIPDSALAPWNRPAPPDPTTFAEVTLEPGDVLYLPAGSWHRAAADGFSMALTIAFPKSSVFELVSYALGRAALPNPAWRRDLPLTSAAETVSGEAPAAVRRAIDEALAALRDLAASVTTDDVLRHWYRTALSRTSDRALPAAPPAPGPIVADDVLEIPDDVALRWFLAPRPDGRKMLCFFGGGAEGTLSAEALPLLQKIGEHRRFAAREVTAWVPGGVPFERLAGLLSALVGFGVLRRAS